MRKDQLAMQIVRQLAGEAAETIINDGFNCWHSHYYGYGCCDDDALQEAVNRLDRMKGCFEKEEISEIFDEAEESYRAKIDPEVWEMYKNRTQRAESDRPVVGIAEDDDLPL